MAHNVPKNIKTQLKKWWPTGLTLMVVLYATLWPDPAGAEDMVFFPGADKLIHAIMMGGLASAIIFDMRRSGQSLTRGVCFRVAAIMIVFSFLDEVAQKSMNLGRAFEWLDLVADSVGVVLGILLGGPVINRIFRRKK